MALKFPAWLVLITALLVCVCLFPEPAQNKSLPGQVDEYERTLRALEQYRLLAAEDDGTLLPETDRPVEPGDEYEGTPRLIRLLRLIGDLPSEAVPSDSDASDSDIYEGALVSAVQRFQERHGLEPDGRIDKATLAELNTPLKFRVRQLDLALERWRRRPYNPSRAAIVLNVPEFRLRAFRANHLELEMKIVDGEPPDHKTPLLSSELQTIVFRPYWNVPVSITRDELVQEIAKDPTFLSANHLEMVGPRGAVLRDPASVEMIERLRAGTLKLRQTPGPKNVLGLAKFEFPNAYGIYMHATSAPWLFAEARRDLSHGCIRVESAADLAEWSLRDEPGWTRDRIEGAMQGPEPVSVRLKRPIQLVTMYVTAVVLENGEVHFFDDIYREDEALEKELAQRPSHLNGALSLFKKPLGAR